MISTTRLKNFTIIKEEVKAEKHTVLTTVEDEVYGIAIYLNGRAKVSNSVFEEVKQAGKLYSFYANPKIGEIAHCSEPLEVLRKITVLFPFNWIKAVVEEDAKIKQYTRSVLNENRGYQKGFEHQLTPQIIDIGNQILQSSENSLLQKLHLESQILALLTQHFLQYEHRARQKSSLSYTDIAKLRHARELLLKQMDSPPSLAQLSKATQLNTFKLKAGFKELFGAPVYKYLQKERMKKAFDLLETKKLSVQETAWLIGYESLSSFSNSFYKMFGIRPSDLRSENK